MLGQLALYMEKKPQELEFWFTPNSKIVPDGLWPSKCEKQALKLRGKYGNSPNDNGVRWIWKKKMCRSVEER